MTTTAPPPVTVPIGPNGVDPTLALTPILNYLRDQDVYRDPQWTQNFDNIEKYLDACQAGRLRGDLGYGSAVLLVNLDLARSMVLVHRRYQTWTMGKTPWSTQTAPLKQFSDRLITYPKVHPQPCDGNNRALFHYKRMDVAGAPQGPSIFYTPAPQLPNRTQDDSDDHYTNVRVQDQTQFWDQLDQHLAQKRANPTTAAAWHPPPANLYDASNQIFQHCIRNGVAETNFRIQLEGLPAPATITTPARNQIFARTRGIKRAALQQLLNIFTNHENRVINTPWRRVILPYDTVTMPKELPYEPRILAPDKVPHRGKEPFPWVHWYNGYTSYLNHIAVRKRAAFNQTNWNQSDRSCLPVNFRGPFINNGHSVHDNYWLRAGKWLVELESHLRDRYAIYPRPLLEAILNDIDAGKIYPYKTPPNKTTTPAAERQLYNDNKRRDLYTRDEEDEDDDDNDADDANSHDPKYKLLTEPEMTWLKFVGEPPRSKRMMDKVDELRQDNLALIFDNRLQEILRGYGTWEEKTSNDPKDAYSVLHAPNRTEPLPIDELLEKINGAETDMLPDDYLRHPNQSYQFTMEEAEHYLRVLWRLHRCMLWPASENTLTCVAPASYNLFPEDRILWRHDDNNTFASDNDANRREFITHMVGAYQDKDVKMTAKDPHNYAGILEHRPSKEGILLADVMAASENEPIVPGRTGFRPTDLQRTHLLRLWFPETHYVQGTYGDDEPQPSVDDVASWEQLWHWVSSKDYHGTAEITCQFLRGLAFRMGTTIQYYKNLQTNLQGKPPIDSNDAIREIDHWTTTVDAGETFTNTAADGSTVTSNLDTPGAQAVVDKADPDKALASTTPDKDPFVLIKKGLINDCVENRSMLYPGHLSAFRNKSQTPFQGVERPNIWSWATSAQRRYQAPYTRKTFFNMRRWPLHHQSEQRQGWIKNRQDEIIKVNPRIQKTGILTARIEPGAMNRKDRSRARASRGVVPPPVDISQEAAQMPDDLTEWWPERPAIAAWDPYDKYRSAKDPQRMTLSDYYKMQRPEDTGDKGNTGKPDKPDKTGQPTPPPDNRQNGNGGKNTGNGGTTGPPDPNKNNQLNPIIRSHQDWIPGPAVYPMGDTLLQQIVISRQLENAIYPPSQVPWGDWLKTKLWEVSHERPKQISLLPETGRATIVRSAQEKRKLPPDYVQNGPAKRLRVPGPPDPRPDSGQAQIVGRRFFRRPGPTAQTPEDKTARRERNNELKAAFPGGYQRIPLPVPVTTTVTNSATSTVTLTTTNQPPPPGLDRGVWAVEGSIAQQHTDIVLPQSGEMVDCFDDIHNDHAHDWYEVRKHNGVVDDSYSGPTYADRMAGALYLYGQTSLQMDLALGIIDSRAPNHPFIHPLPKGHNRAARIIWVFYDGQAARWRPTPPRKDQAWLYGDFDYWYPVGAAPPPQPPVDPSNPQNPNPNPDDTDPDNTGIAKPQGTSILTAGA